MQHRPFDKLRIELARQVGIDADRIRIEETDTSYLYRAAVQGPIAQAVVQLLRAGFNNNTAAHIIVLVEVE